MKNFFDLVDQPIYKVKKSTTDALNMWKHILQIKWNWWKNNSTACGNFTTTDSLAKK